MGPNANKTSSSQKQSIPAISTFQIDAYERRRLKSFPPRAAPKPRVIRFSARGLCRHLRSDPCQQCLAGKKYTTVSNATSGDTKPIISRPNVGLPEICFQIDKTVAKDLPYC